MTATYTDTTKTMKRRKQPRCYQCIRMDVKVAGELCIVCAKGGPYERSYGKSPELSDWSLEQLIATQDSGEVPGRRKWQDNETSYDEADERYTIY